MSHRLFIVLALLIVSTACSSPRDTPEAEVERFLEAGAAALEARSLDALEQLVSDNFRDDHGRDKKTLLRTALLAFQRGPVRVFRAGTRIDANPNLARVSFTAHALQGREIKETPLDLLPQRARTFRIELELIWEGDAWRLRRLQGVPTGH